MHPLATHLLATDHTAEMTTKAEERRQAQTAGQHLMEVTTGGDLK